MDILKQNPSLSPKRLKEKADILETNLFKNISNQSNPSRVEIIIERGTYPDAVITKALVQLFPRFNIQPRTFLLSLRDLMAKDIPEGKEEKFDVDLDVSEEEGLDDITTLTRIFEAVLTKSHLKVVIHGVQEIQSEHGQIGKAYFDYELSPGQMLRDGIIDFKEINKFPIVNQGDKLFYISHEIQGKPGLSVTGELIDVFQAKPYPIEVGDGIDKIEDFDAAGDSKGFYLISKKTGVVLLTRNEQKKITSIAISDQIESKFLDYSTGNIGTRYVCPVRMKIGTVCSGFKIRVNDLVEIDVVDGADIITNHNAIITIAQSGSSIVATKNITIGSVIHSKITSEQGKIILTNELVDSNIHAPEIIFEKNKGFITNSNIEAESLQLKGCYFSGENIIYFGNKLFTEEDEQKKELKKLQTGKELVEDQEKYLMEQLQQELKKLTKLATKAPDLVQHIKPLILATNTMAFEIINKEMDAIQKRNNTRIVASVRKIFEALEKVPQTLKNYNDKIEQAGNVLRITRRRMTRIKLCIEGHLRRGTTLKVFCGIHDKKEKMEPDFYIECEGDEERHISVTATYSADLGFQFVR